MKFALKNQYQVYKNSYINLNKKVTLKREVSSHNLAVLATLAHLTSAIYILQVVIPNFYLGKSLKTLKTFHFQKT